jgi:hypothetical protein
VVVTAGGFRPGDDVDLVFIPAAGAAIDFHKTKVGSDGRFSVKLDLPPYMPLGAGQMAATGMDASGQPFVRTWALLVVAGN